MRSIPHAFRAAMARFATGVTIVTTRDRSASDWGMTASAVSQLSLDPPLLLVCLAAAAGSTPAFAQSERFAVSVLRPEHEELALRFATGRPDKFILGGFEHAPSGLPVLSDALAVVECATDRVLPGGDHVIVIGVAQHARAADGAALVRFGPELGALAPIAP